MSLTGCLAFLPITVLAGSVLIVMLSVAAYRSHALTGALTAAGLVASLACLPLAAAQGIQQVTPLFVIDGYGLLFIALFTGAALVTTLLCYAYFKALTVRHEELYLLLLVAVVGASALATSSHLASFFLGLETTSVALFALIGYCRDGAPSIEAALKYLVLTGVSTAFLVFGMALLYAQTGALALAELPDAIGAGGDGLLLPSAFSLIIVGVGFKLSVAPFHWWTPDVYQGAPAPITGFLATVSKGAVFALILRYLVTIGAPQQGVIDWLLTGIAIASMLLGNWLALLQDNIKRLLAYSSIAHLGYLLVPLIAGSALAVEAASYYLVAYFVTILGAFGVISMLPLDEDGSETMGLAAYQGLFWRRPWLAGILTLMLLSLAGIPLTAGFIAKFYALAAGVDTHLWLLVLVLIAGSAISLYYYLRVVITMAQPLTDTTLLAKRIPVSGATALALAVVLLIVLGIYPEPLLELIRPAAATLF